MAFEEDITRSPLPLDPTVGAEAADMVAAIGHTRSLIAGAAGSSPYIADLVRREADWLSAALKLAPDAAFATIMETLVDGPADTALRRAKRRVALITALADLGGAWSLEQVTGALTRFADAAVAAALRGAIAVEIARGKLPGQGEDDIATCGGLAVLAMGKMGAFELNYSSDIDLICVYDQTRFAPDDYADARAAFVRAVRRMTKTLSERTSDGYVFRTDLRLRPDASVTPVAISMEAAERYYESFGRTWERAAYIKARAAAGDTAAGAAFLSALDPFVWRRHLDFWAIQDAHDMRLRIRDHKGLHGDIDPFGHDLKLGLGGIREIEFFTQTRQIIAGGRDPSLRVPTTKGGLDALAAAGWVSKDDAEVLKGHYTALRDAEHRVQMVADQQTHVLPANRGDFARVAALSGTDAATYAADIRQRLTEVAAIIDRFFVRARSKAPAPVPDAAQAITDRWPGYPALRSPRAVEIFDRVRPLIFDRLAKAADPDEALRHFDGFLAGLPAGVQVFSLFDANPQLLELVIDITATAPALAQYLSRNAAVFEAVIVGDFFADWPGCDGLATLISGELSRCGDYEERLDRCRVVAREWRFRVGVHHLRGLIDAAEAGRQYADVAEAVLRALWPHVVATFADKHGAPPGRGAAVLGMGSLGARRLNATSDLDLIVIYDGQGIDTSDGRRPLATRAYYARLTQALVTAISAPTAEGRLYEVDMRLRPSGRQGPVATGLSAFRDYQMTEAWTWEHLALTRARPVAGEAALWPDIDAVRRDVLAHPRDRAKVLSDVTDMRARLAEAAPPRGPLDAKAGPGRVQDIDLFRQTGVILTGAADEASGARAAFDLSDADERAISTAATLFLQVQAASRLIASGPLDDATLGPGACAFLLRENGCDSLGDLAAKMAACAREAAEIIDRHIVSAPDTGKA
ncbi:MAG: glutamine-synthetase adenylyltransferase [Pseudomonadota bacterium]